MGGGKQNTAFCQWKEGGRLKRWVDLWVVIYGSLKSEFQKLLSVCNLEEKFSLILNIFFSVSVIEDSHMVILCCDTGLVFVLQGRPNTDDNPNLTLLLFHHKVLRIKKCMHQFWKQLLYPTTLGRNIDLPLIVCPSFTNGLGHLLLKKLNC